MHTPSEQTALAAANVPAALKAPPPLTLGEQASPYDDFLARVTATVKPADVLEEMWIRDIVDLEWDVLRLRRLKAALMTARASGGVQATLSALSIDNAYAYTCQWAARDPEALADFDDLLASAGLTMDHVMAQTLRLNIDVIERIERMSAGVEARRNGALGQIANHHAHFAGRLRNAVRDIAATAEDAEFEVVAPDQTGQGPTALG